MTRRVALLDVKLFAKDALNKACSVYVMHVKHVLDPPFSFPSNTVPKAVSVMDLKQKAFDATEITIPKTYKEFLNIFSNNNANIFPEHGPDNYAIDLIDNKQSPYGPVYNLSKVELTMLR